MVSVESNFNERAFFGKLLKRTDFTNVFRTLPNIHDEGFVEKRLNNFQLLIIFAKELYYRCFTRF